MQVKQMDMSIWRCVFVYVGTLYLSRTNCMKKVCNYYSVIYTILVDCEHIDKEETQ